MGRNPTAAAGGGVWSVVLRLVLRRAGKIAGSINKIPSVSRKGKGRQPAEVPDGGASALMAAWVARMRQFVACILFSVVASCEWAVFLVS